MENYELSFEIMKQFVEFKLITQQYEFLQSSEK